MAYKITFTNRFSKSYKKLSDQEKKQIKKTVDQLVQNPLHPSLRTKKIKGTCGFFECSVNMDVRMVWYFESGSVIVILDVGHHDILRRQ